MKQNSLQQPGIKDPEFSQENWISREEVKNLFPAVTDRQLKYWRESKKVRSQTIKNRTSYIESDVREQLKKLELPIKRARRRAKWIQKKFASINPVFGIAFLTVLFLFVTNKSYLKNATYNFWDFATPFLFLLFFCSIYGLVKLIAYLWKRWFRKNDEND